MADQELDYEPLARAHGWVPKEEFRGEHGAEFKDAKTYYEQAMNVLPILRKTNQGLHADLAATRTELNQLKADLRASNATLKTVVDSQEEDLKERTEAMRRSLLADIKQAKKDDDTDREVDLEEELRQLDRAAAPKKAAPEAPSQTETSSVPPEALAAYNAWASANPWYSTDVEKRNVAFGLATAIRAENPALSLTPFYAELDKRLAKLYPSASRRGGDSKVEGSGSGGEQQPSGEGKSFTDLPPEAKAQARKQEKMFVGKDRKYKTAAEWHSAYAQTYWSQG